MKTANGKKIRKKHYISCAYGGTASANRCKWKMKEFSGDLFEINSSGYVVVNRDTTIIIDANIMWFNGSQMGCYLHISGTNVQGGATGGTNITQYDSYGFNGVVYNAKAGDYITVDCHQPTINSYQPTASYLIVKEL